MNNWLGVLAGPFRAAGITEPGIAPSYCSAKVVSVSLNNLQIHLRGTGLEQRMWSEAAHSERTVISGKDGAFC